MAWLEAGQQEPAWPLVLMLAEALGVTPNDFRAQEGEALPAPPKRGRPPVATGRQEFTAGAPGR